MQGIINRMWVFNKRGYLNKKKGIHFVEEKQNNFILKKSRIRQRKKMTISECKKKVGTVL